LDILNKIKNTINLALQLDFGKLLRDFCLIVF
jgi:hypothetical protein